MDERDLVVMQKEMEYFKEKMRVLMEDHEATSNDLTDKVKILETKLDELIGYFNELSKQLSTIIPDIDRRLGLLENHECKCNNESYECEKEDGQA